MPRRRAGGAVGGAFCPGAGKRRSTLSHNVRFQPDPTQCNIQPHPQPPNSTPLKTNDINRTRSARCASRTGRASPSARSSSPSRRSTRGCACSTCELRLECVCSWSLHCFARRRQRLAPPPGVQRRRPAPGAAAIAPRAYDPAAARRRAAAARWLAASPSSSPPPSNPFAPIQSAPHIAPSNPTHQPPQPKPTLSTNTTQHDTTQPNSLFHLHLNVLGELTRFGDREFYRDFWNAATLGDYWRSWNMPVHKFLLRTVYFPAMRAGVSRCGGALCVLCVCCVCSVCVLCVCCAVCVRAASGCFTVFGGRGRGVQAGGRAGLLPLLSGGRAGARRQIPAPPSPPSQTPSPPPPPYKHPHNRHPATTITITP